VLQDRQQNQPEKRLVESVEEKISFFSLEINRLSGSQIIKRLLEGQYPQELIRRLSNQDFLWLIKKVGEDDSHSLLAMATDAQWQYVLDLELWEKDRFQIDRTREWLKRFFKADSRRLAQWLFTEGQYLAYSFFYRILEVISIDPDQYEEQEIPEDYFSLDGTYYIQVKDEEYLSIVKDILQEMLDTDSERYFWFLLSLGGIIPAETEEEMYRLRNARIAEEGFLSFDEAVGAYDPLDPSLLKYVSSQSTFEINVSKEKEGKSPFMPLFHAGEKNLLGEVLGRQTDPLFLDRLRLEFAGLCNQIYIADGHTSFEVESLANTCRKTAGYINIALEERTGGDPAAAEKLMKSNSLLSIFRAGINLAMQLKWEADRVVRKSWFITLGLMISFWGDPWGKTVEGLRKRRPLLYAGIEAKEPYRDFERISDLEETRGRLGELKLLDDLFGRLDRVIPLDRHMSETGDFTFQPLLVTFWARKYIGITPGYLPFSIDEAKKFFDSLRGSGQNPLRRTAGGWESFVNCFMEHTTGIHPIDKSTLEKALLHIWQEFTEEYESVSSTDLDSRYSKLIMIEK
jgi:hypothetical protein